jgi:hypothetical protein
MSWWAEVERFRMPDASICDRSSSTGISEFGRGETANRATPDYSSNNGTSVTLHSRIIVHGAQTSDQVRQHQEILHPHGQESIDDRVSVHADRR